MRKPLHTVCFLLLVLAAVYAVEGCRKPAADAVESASDQAHWKSYPLRGKVISTNSATGEVTLQHEAIANFMGAMTMPYKLRDTRILGELHPGDLVTADVMVSQAAYAAVYVDHFVVTGQAKADYVPAVQFHVPQAGDAVPDFHLVNQDGKPIHLAQFHGKALLVTFIYTSCPLPDFCPRVTRNFATIENSLKTDQGLFTKTHLLCVSFDPATDTPARLKSYGMNYIRSDDVNVFAHWDFAVPSQQVLPVMARFFDVGITNEADNTITHTLSTTLIGPDGKVVRFYPGNEWTPEQVIADVRKILPKA